MHFSLVRGVFCWKTWNLMFFWESENNRRQLSTGGKLSYPKFQPGRLLPNKVLRNSMEDCTTPWRTAELLCRTAELHEGLLISRRTAEFHQRLRNFTKDCATSQMSEELHVRLQLRKRHEELRDFVKVCVTLHKGLRNFTKGCLK